MRYGYDDYDDFELQEIQEMKEAEARRQADEYYAEQEWIKQMEKEDAKKHQPTREEKYPGVVFTPRIKINTICENDDIPF